MKLKKISIFEFDNFAKNHPLGSYHQTAAYAMLASEQGYDYELIGMIDNNNNIVAASLILIKKLGLFYKYGYAPKGFLINYYDPNILEEFVTLLKKEYFKQNFAFIKINPEISIGKLNNKTKQIKYNYKNYQIENTLKKLNFKKLEGNNRFETKFPKFNSILVLKNTEFKLLSKNTRNKINKSIKNGLIFEKGNRESIPIIYNFIKNKKDHSIHHYYNYYNAFAREKNIDMFLVKIDFENCLINLREKYEKEYLKNSKITELLMIEQSQENLKKKLESDKTLNTLNENIATTTKYLSEHKEKYIAGAITIKYKNRISILISGFDKEFKNLCPNYFLHYNLIEYYKKDYDFMDLNGITGDFTETNPYKGLNEFKMGFNPESFEFIGEWDLIINDGLYKSLDQSGQLAKEFKRKEKSIIE
ncbi:MAG: peptidoglycan bridge formation glycyltransferase FemA/FemB family protein [Bacilli bacterium]|nr:peptidoglycan bridge formation glycyltransferase FemA/FemB family protein [Bacilli bacterium]